MSLDQEQYEETLNCLAANCIYDSPTGEIVGPQAIVASYQHNGDQATKKFDGVDYSHQVAALDDGWFEITFRDDLRIGDRSHTFQCRQRIRVIESSIAQIVHQEIPGQREGLNQFLSPSEKT